MKIKLIEKCLVCGGTGTEPNENSLMKKKITKKCHHCKGKGLICTEKDVREVKIPMSDKLQKATFDGYALFWEA